MIFLSHFGNKIALFFLKDAYFWSCTKAALLGVETHAYSFESDYYSAIAYTSYAPYKASALAVRCVKD